MPNCVRETLIYISKEKVSPRHDVRLSTGITSTIINGSPEVLRKLMRYGDDSFFFRDKKEKFQLNYASGNFLAQLQPPRLSARFEKDGRNSSASVKIKLGVPSDTSTLPID